MPDSATVQWRDVTSHILERNGAITLNPMSVENDAFSDEFSYGSRLLDMTAKHLVVEVPNSVQGRQHFEPEARVHVTMVYKTMRVELTCKVKGRIKHKINSNVEVIAYELSHPTQIRSAQRRAFFRASVSAMPIAPIIFTPMDPAFGHPVYDKSINANLINISGGGMGLIIHKNDVEKIIGIKQFECELELPQDEGKLKLILLCQVMHTTTGRRGDVYTGIQFIMDDATEKKETVDMLVKYTTWVQREHLKHQHR